MKITKQQVQEVKQEARERLSQKTTPPFWKKVRNVSGVVFLVGSTLISLGMPAVIPVAVAQWIPIITAVSGAISGSASLTKKGNAKDLIDAIKDLNWKEKALLKQQINKQIKTI